MIGNVVVYRDKHHLTKGYALSLVPALEEKLVEAALQDGDRAEFNQDRRALWLRICGKEK